ncbi:prion-inhibition and propagation-domain-containing protein [Crucibulum laeve]|uniref:Prion-inhibition and propagation-domain-containing protein n=1 Tax=Crucibulum laeve TaxID=68775 RepID=A0A5C3M9D0_9AGAR|nr:prion-inhibition and propagation-domain-containing protein [Crucibulum laeve]
MAELLIGTIAFVGQCYSGAIQAYLTLQRCIEFPDTSGKLILQLEVERIRLQLWGESSGAGEGVLHPRLAPFESTIASILNRITKLLQDSDRLKESYGLVERPALDTNGDPVVPDQGLRAALQVKSIVSDVFTSNRRRRGLARLRHPSQTSPSSAPQQSPTTYDRVRWAISSQARFESLIADLRSFVDSLNQLLRESQQVALLQEWRLLELQTIAGIEDRQALHAIQEATEGDPNCRALFSMAGKKSIVISKPLHGRTANGFPEADASLSTVKVLSKNDFDLPEDFHALSRCISVYNPLDNSHGVAEYTHVLIEKKHYDPDISGDDKFKLLFRLRRLIELLNSPRGDDDSFLTCLGYWDESASSCWCLVYRYPLNEMSTPPTSGMPSSMQPPSLLHLLTSDTFKPSLESRLRLASTISSCFSDLYGSKWLHKGIRSENIIFPLTSGTTHNISKPFIAGFEYSRQYTEQATIDQTPFDITQAIYRHPKYQGLAARGYRLTYDIYSLGLVLAEIAWWMPLKSFLQARIKSSSGSTASSRRPLAAVETQTQTQFGAEEAAELRRCRPRHRL